MAIANRAEAQTSLSESDDAISRCLVDARLSAQPLPNFPGRLPVTLEQTYAIQSASIARWPEEVAGWKVAKLSATDRARFPAERFAGPIFKSSTKSVEPGSRKVMAVYEGGFAAIEAEYALVPGAVVPPSDKVYSDEELADLVSAVYGAESFFPPGVSLLHRTKTWHGHPGRIYDLLQCNTRGCPAQ